MRTGSEAVANDLWTPYLRSTLAHVPAAERTIMSDPYHLGRMLGDAVDAVRNPERRRPSDRTNR